MDRVDADEYHRCLILFLDDRSLTQQEVGDALGWDYRKVNQVLTDLRLAGKIRNEPPVREKGSKVTRYSLKEPRR